MPDKTAKWHGTGAWHGVFIAEPCGHAKDVIIRPRVIWLARALLLLLLREVARYAWRG